MTEGQQAPAGDSILVVDDDEVFGGILARSLTRRGFSVQVAQSIDAAMHLAREHPPQAAVVDLKIADESGLSLIPQLLELNRHMNIVILTGYSSVSTAVEAIKLGAGNYLCKPVNTDEILHALEQRDADPSVQIPLQPPSVERLEWEHIQRVLKECDNNISETARRLGMHRRTLQRKLSKRPVSH